MCAPITQLYRCYEGKLAKESAVEESRSRMRSRRRKGEQVVKKSRRRKGEHVVKKSRKRKGEQVVKKSRRRKGEQVVKKSR